MSLLHAVRTSNSSEGLRQVHLCDRIWQVVGSANNGEFATIVKLTIMYINTISLTQWVGTGLGMRVKLSYAPTQSTILGISLDFGHKGRFYLDYQCFWLIGVTSTIQTDMAQTVELFWQKVVKKDQVRSGCPRFCHKFWDRQSKGRGLARKNLSNDELS